MSESSHPPLEIERVYLLSRLPELPPGSQAYRIEQGYLPEPIPGPGDPSSDEATKGPGHDAVARSADDPPSKACKPGEGSVVEGRLRRRVGPDGAVRCFHTIKQGEGLVRTEIERELTEAEFAEEWAQTAGRRISKTRHKVRELDLTWEVDDFDDLDLVMAEVELPSAETEVELPSWLAKHVVRELTYDPRYRNFCLATQGLPTD